VEQIHHTGPSENQRNILIEHYQKGQLEAAERLARSLTEKFPSDQLAWKVLGAVLGQTGRKLDALNVIQKAVQLAPKDAEVYNHLGNALKELGRLEEATKSYQQAVVLNPMSAESHYNLGNTLKQMRRLEEAEGNYRQAVVLKSDYIQAYNNLGNTLQERGMFEKAEVNYKRVIGLKPDYAEAYCNLGTTLQELERLDEAEISYKQAIALKPNFAAAHNNLGKVMQELDKQSNAEINYKQALAFEPGLTEAYYNLANTFQKLDRVDEAVKYFNVMLIIDSNDALGAYLQLASIGSSSIPSSTPKAYMKSFYKNKSKSWGSGLNNKYQGHLLIEKAIEQTYDRPQKMCILDLGCGTGSMASFLYSYANMLHGVDLSPEMLIKASKTGLYDTLYEQDLVLYLKENLNNYDMIVAAAVIIHFFDLELVFYMIHKSLKPGGNFIFSVFEETENTKALNSFMMYSHSAEYITELANRLNFKICYEQKGIHEYHKKKPVNALIYVLTKCE
jgi:predicted TPR repeat methyltransferase